MRLYRNLFFFLFCVAFFSAFFPLWAEEKIPLLKSFVRIIEGVVAADWEQRFLTPEQLDGAPDHDALHNRFSPIAPPEGKHSRSSRSVSKESRAKNGISPEKRPSQVPRFEASSPTTSPHSREQTEGAKTSLSVTPSPSSSLPPKSSLPPASPKVDKAGEVDDDNTEKRKKERREILREERKEREYRNRRIE